MGFESLVQRVMGAEVVVRLKMPRLAAGQVLCERLHVRMPDGIPPKSFTLMYGMDLMSSGQVVPVSSSSSALAPFSPTSDCSLSCCSWSCEALQGPPSRWPKVGASSMVSSIQRRTVCTRMGWGMSLVTGGEGRYVRCENGGSCRRLRWCQCCDHLSGRSVVV